MGARGQGGWGGGPGKYRKSQVKVKQTGIHVGRAACAKGWDGRKRGGLKD